MPGSACSKEPDIAVSWEALAEPDKYRGGCSQPTIGLSMGSPVKELEKGMKEVKGWRGLQPHRKNNMNQPDTPPPTSQGRIHQPRDTHGGNHGFSCICSRGWPCQSSIGREALCPVKAWWMPQCRGVQGWRGRNGWEGQHPHRSRGWGDGIGGFKGMWIWGRG